VSADNSTAGPVGYDGEHIGNPSKLSTAVDAAAASMHDRAGSSVAACVEYAALLLRRYALAGYLADVEAALGAGEVAVSRAGDNPRARAVALNVLANARAAVFQVRGGRVAAAVAAQREAVELLDPADPDRAALQVNLADRLLAAHIVTRERELVEEAVRLGEDVLARDLPSAWRAAALDGLGRALRARYDHTGNRRDLERSAAAQAESLAGTPTAAPERAARLNNLANARWVSYQVTGDLGALDDAVAGYQEAARAAMNPEARAACLLGLGSAHWAEWSRHRTTVDLDAATAAYTEALTHVPVDTPIAAHCRLDLGAAHLAHWRERGRTDDLDTAIEHWTFVRTATSAEPDVVEAATGNLAAALWERYETRHDERDLDQAVDLLVGGLDRPGTSTPSGQLLTLAGALRRRHALHGDPADLTAGLAHYRSACAAGLASDPAVALVAGQRWGAWASEQGRLVDADRAYVGATTAALRLYGWQGTQAHVRVWLGEAVGLAEQHAWVQCRLDRPAAAVLTLERGRAYLLSEALGSRPPGDEGQPEPGAAAAGGGSVR
jgi:hypothetical protein